MSYNTKKIKGDLEGKPIPQNFNDDIDDYDPQKGLYGAASMYQLGTFYVDGWEGNATETKPLSEVCHGFFIVNDGTGDLTATIGDKTTHPIKGGEKFGFIFPPFTEVTITVLTATTYRVDVSR